jgi:ATP-dependent Clp endopeptidase proteolytic subunit ClpP
MQFLEFVAQSPKEVDVLMYGSVSRWNDFSAARMAEMLTQARDQGFERVNLRINSPGGSIFEGLAIYYGMQAFTDLEIVGMVDGMAASMASIILLGCDVRKMGKASRIMTHQGMLMTEGSANQLIRSGKMLQSLNETLAEIYAEKSGKETQWVLDNWMQEGVDQWFTADQAMKAGLVSEVYGSKVKPPAQAAEGSFGEMAAHYIEAVTALDQSQSTNSNSPLMKFNFFEKFPKLSALVGAPEGITPEVLDAVNAELSEKGITGLQVTTPAAITTLADTKAALQAKHDALQSVVLTVAKKLNPEFAGTAESFDATALLASYDEQLATANARIAELEQLPGARHTNPQKPQGDDLGEATAEQKEIDELAHNKSIDDNPRFTFSPKPTE